MNRIVVAAISAIFLFSCSSRFDQARAQAVATAQISGTVRDPNGAAIPGAKVTVTRVDTGLVRTAETGSQGNYLLPELPVGPYRMQVEANGFGSYVQNGIVLQVSDSPRIDVGLQLGQVNQQVEVTADASMVKTDTTAVSQVIDQARIVDLPLNGRQRPILNLLVPVTRGSSTTANKPLT